MVLLAEGVPNGDTWTEMGRTDVVANTLSEPLGRGRMDGCTSEGLGRVPQAAAAVGCWGAASSLSPLTLCPRPPLPAQPQTPTSGGPSP